VELRIRRRATLALVRRLLGVRRDRAEIDQPVDVSIAAHDGHIWVQ